MPAIWLDQESGRKATADLWLDQARKQVSDWASQNGLLADAAGVPAPSSPAPEPLGSTPSLAPPAAPPAPAPMPVPDLTPAPATFPTATEPPVAPAGVGTAGVPSRSGSPAARTSQFGMGLGSEDAYAFCGPAAAMAFANTYGRNPTVQEAKALAQRYGWTNAQGMAGLQSEQKLLSEGLGVASHAEFNVDWSKVAKDASSGNPVIISTPVHYFYITGYNPQDGTYNVGTSGTDMRAGRQWMTGDQIAQLGGGLQGALYADNPQSPTPSVAAAVGGALDSLGTNVSQGLQQFQSGQEAQTRGQQQAAEQVPAAFAGALADAGRVMQEGQDTNVAGMQAVNAARRENFPNILEPGHPLSPEVQGPAQEAMGRIMRGEAPQPGDQEALSRAAMAVGGIESSAANFDRYGVEAGFKPPLSKVPAAGLTAEDLAAMDPAATQFRRETGNKIVPVEQQSTPSLLRGLINEAKARGIDVSEMEARLNGELPPPGAAPVGDELMGPSGPQRGQLGFDTQGNPDPIPYGGPRPIGDEARGPSGAQPGQWDLGLDTGRPGQNPIQGQMVPPRAGEFAPPTAPPADPLAGRKLDAGLLNQAAAKLPPVDPNAAELTKPKSLMLQLGEEGRQFHMPGTPTEGSRAAGRYTVPNKADPKPSNQVADKLIALRYGSTLSSWYTHVSNIASNTGQAFVQPAREAAAGYPGVAGARIRGMAEGIPDGIRMAWDALVNGAGAAASKTDTAHPRAFGSGPLGRAIEFPSDMLAATDRFFQQVAYSGSIRAQATELAKRDAGQFAELLKNPTAAMQKEAEAMAKVSTYTEDPGPFVNWLLKGRDGAEMRPRDRLAVNFLFLFVRTPANILRRGVGLTAQPFTGPVKTVAKLAKGDVKGARLEAADTALAGVVMAGLAAKAMQGDLVSNGPQDPAARKMFTAQGGQPHSIRIGNTYYPTKLFGPMGVEMENVAALWEGYSEAKSGAPSEKVLLNMANNLKNAALEQSFLSGMPQLFSNTPGTAERVLAQYATSMVPYGQAISDATAARDQYERQPGEGVTGIGQRIAERLPVARDTVPIEQTPLGEPLANQKQGLKAFRTTEVRPNATMQMFEQAGVAIPQPDAGISLDIGRGRSITVQITPAEQRTWQQRFGDYVQQQTAEIQKDPSFASAPIEARAKFMQQVADRARHFADKDMAQRIGDAELERRVNEDQATRERKPLRAA